MCLLGNKVSQLRTPKTKGWYEDMGSISSKFGGMSSQSVSLHHTHSLSFENKSWGVCFNIN